MGNTVFKFKQFEMYQDRCGMKISTDAVVLGAIAEETSVKSILDIGAGTGVISLMLAQRFTEASVQAVELDEEAYLQSLENVKTSPFSDRVKVYHASFQDFALEKSAQYDLIVSNPPYFPDHLKSQDLQRNQALHNDKLSFEDLAKGVARLLNQKGSFWVILPPRQMEEFSHVCSQKKLFPIFNLKLRDKAASKVIREVQAFSFDQVEIEKRELYIKNIDGSFALNYRILLQDFLTIF
ncbi:tRNA1Val (adenine37-N6)-methyltransferase [Belliella buryatensis]|uniref:tRNA1(Val) (adenine(37)-N6)-methyltransferase n=1 Tax=Belliella buryatensis TaxID=1500549 RepID=A0A239B4Q2_9BACT|nr:methyltransferase [Belliella buryatensis]SNS02204.1 tRNA1Val (adenine37-N6)-methyltransferase [Belliella buryatensis]